MKKTIFIIATGACLAGAAAIHTSQSRLKACIWSYEGLIDYNLAAKGCKTGRLQKLSERKQVAIWESSDRQIAIISEELTNQAKGL